SPFYIVDKTRPWPVSRGADGRPAPRRAGVSSFGYGGANAHAVLEEFVLADAQPAPAAKPAYLLTFSARSREGLDQALLEFADWLERSSAMLEEISCTRNRGRDHFEHRVAMVVSSLDELRAVSRDLRAGQRPPKLLWGPDGPETAQPALRALLEQLTAGLVTGTDPAAYRSQLEALAALYAKGYDLDWERIHHGERRRRIRLPGYPFRKDRYWVPESSSSDTPALPESAENLVFLQPVWIESPLAGSNGAGAGEPVLVFDRERSWLLPPQGMAEVGKVIRVTAGPVFRRLGPEEFSINPERPDDYGRLLSELRRQGTICRRVVHAWSKGGLDPLSPALKDWLWTGARSVFCLVKALFAGGPTDSVKLVFVVEPGLEGAEVATGTVAAFLRVVRLEHPEFGGRTVTFESTVAGNTWKCITRELADHGPEVVEARYSVRGREVRRLVPANLREPTPTMRLRDRGVYWITGGGGALGLIFAEHLAQAPGARIILSGRKPLDAELRKKIDRLEALGASVSYLACDLANPEDVNRTVSAIRAQWGALHGVIHAAGCVCDGLITEKRAADFDAVMAAKILGTVHLELATRPLAPDWIVLFSSTSAVFGNVGQSDYAAANGFMDHFAAWPGRSAGTGSRDVRLLSINWPYWKDGAMKAGSDASEQAAWESWTQEALGWAPLERAEGRRAFDLCLASPAHQIVVVKRPAGVERGPEALAPRAAAASAASDLEISPPMQRLQAMLLEDVRQALKAEAADTSLTANFREMGFDSISLKLFARHLCDRYRIQLAPSALFAYPTCAQLAAHLVETFPAVLDALTESRGQGEPGRI
ncbi:MAG: SDR family NAD(P)-dependent oxidoreductase, partial [Verrucomicrobia bacterium]|nr:SDR family NAD(P)-dependent oxidoreductase [Verrucomicrobiota bacterium]